MKRARLLTPGTLFFSSGWLLAVALVCFGAQRAAHRLYLSFPSGQREDFREALAQKKQELAVPWKDSRPLVIMAGDSEIELGDWYQLLGGSFAVRNCGLSRAKISDVAELISAVGDRHPKAVVLMCGINNLGNHNPVDACARDYEQLILKAQSTLNPNRIIVLSVMPVRKSAVDRNSEEINRQVAGLDQELQRLCKRHHAGFLDVTTAVNNRGGGLSPELTFDGVHLNLQGYQKVAAVLANALSDDRN